MINQELKTFIDKMRKAGKTETEISSELGKAGWPETEISRALVTEPKSFFTPRPLWDFLVLLPPVYLAIFTLFVGWFIDRQLSAFTNLSFESFQNIFTFFPFLFLMMPFNIIVSVVTIAEYAYLFSNRKKVSASKDTQLVWGIAALVFGLIIIPYLHFRYLRNRSQRFSMLISGIVALFFVAMTVGVVMVVMRIKSYSDHISNRINDNYMDIKNTFESIVPGEIVVGFKKEVTEKEAMDLLNGFGLEFYKSDNIKPGKSFFYNIEEGFIVKVPPGEEGLWMDKLQKEPKIYGVSRKYKDSKDTIID